VNPKVAVGLLAIIVLLFVFGAGCGAVPKGDQSLHPGWTTTLQNVLVKKATASDLRSDPGSCVQGSSVVVLATRTCQFAVDDTRRVLLSPPQQGSATLRVSTKRGFEGPPKLNDKGVYDFTVSKGDTFFVSCGGFSSSPPCQLDLSS
jgi:hypothetical protein